MIIGFKDTSLFKHDDKILYTGKHAAKKRLNRINEQIDDPKTKHTIILICDKKDFFGALSFFFLLISQCYKVCYIDILSIFYLYLDNTRYSLKVFFSLNNST